MTLLLAAAIGLIALIVTPGFFFYFDVTPKLILLLVAAACGMAILRPVNRWFSWLISLSLLSLALSTAFSVHPALSLFSSETSPQALPPVHRSLSTFPGATHSHTSS